MLEEFGGDIFQWLRGFYYIVQTGSFSRAGEVMHRNQSSITYQLKKLEETLGVSLIHRKSNPLRLTPEGERLYPIVTRMFDCLQQIRTEVGHSSEQVGRISVTSPYGIAVNHLPSQIYRYRLLHPLVEIDILPERTAFVEQAYTTESSDFVITQHDLLPAEAHFIPIYTTELALIIPQSWKNPPSPISLDYLAAQPVIGLVRELPLDQCVLESMRDAKLQLNVVQYAGFFMTALHYVALGSGISVLGREQAQMPGYAVKVFSLSHLFPKRVYGIAHRPHQYLAPHVRSFIKFLQEDSQLHPHAH